MTLVYFRSRKWGWHLFEPHCYFQMLFLTVTYWEAGLRDIAGFDPGHCVIAVCKISQKNVSHEFAGFPMGVRMCVCVCVSHSVMSDCLLPHVAYQAPLCMEILQARILEWVAIPFCRGSSQPRDWTQVSITARSPWKTALQAVFIVWASNFIQVFSVRIKVIFILYCNISVQ